MGHRSHAAGAASPKERFSEEVAGSRRAKARVTRDTVAERVDESSPHCGRDAIRFFFVYYYYWLGWYCLLPPEVRKIINTSIMVMCRIIVGFDLR